MALGVGAGMLTAPAIAEAAPTDSAAFVAHLQHDVVALDDVNLDTGWIPANSPVQLRLLVHAADSVTIDMSGEATYDWSSESLMVEGHDDAGRLALDLGVQLEAKVRFDVAGNQWESDLLGPYDVLLDEEGKFTPFLLPGHPQRPFALSDETETLNVASIDLVPNVVVASGTLEIDLRALLDASLSGERIDVLTDQDAVMLTEEGQSAIVLPDPGGASLDAEGILECRLTGAPQLVVHPRLVMTIGNQTFDLGTLDVPVDLPPLDETLRFEPVPMSFERPEPPAGDGGEGSGDGRAETGDESGVGTTSATSGASDTDTEGSAGQIDELGDCACRSDGERPFAWLGALVLLLGLRRRSRS